jgi:hypothetical protein
MDHFWEITYIMKYVQNVTEYFADHTHGEKREDAYRLSVHPELFF